MKKCISPKFNEDAELCSECLDKEMWNDMSCHVPDTEERCLIEDAAFALENLCDDISCSIGCERCTYHDEETHICEVRVIIDKLNAKAKV